LYQRDLISLPLALIAFFVFFLLSLILIDKRKAYYS
jgi:hypothetical protein